MYLKVTLVVLAAALGLSCSKVDCPAGSVEQSGHCMELNSIDTAGTGGTDGAAATAAVSGAAANSGAGPLSGNGALGGASGDGSLGSGNAGSGPMAGSSSMSMSGGAFTPEPCTEAGAQRCSMTGVGKREMCTNGNWMPGQPCGAGETCLEEAGVVKCVLVAELCRGNAGQTVCDAQGSLVVCNADESIGSMMACQSAKHCQAGIASKTCAMCIPMQDHRCTGAALEQCAPDGMSFVNAMTCETVGLCNAMLGKCTDAVCEPGQKSCDGSKLVTCNENGTAVMGMETCANGMCDAKGGDCNMCEPGTKKCDGDMVATCDATGQSFEPTACPNGQKCVGLGQCVQCAGNEDCTDLTQGCKVGVCMKNMCMAGNAPNNMECMAAGNKPGKCASGTCNCAPQCDGKECGDNGCSGQCGTCSGGKKCSSAQQCVDCLTNSDCKSSNPCQRGVCSGGSCNFEPLDSGSCNGNGTCQNGTCCTPNCSGKCGGESNGCGGTCPAPNCGNGQLCKAGKCCDNSCDGLCGGAKNECGTACNAKCCSTSCAGKCGNQTNECGQKCPDPCPGQTCNAGKCLECTKNSDCGRQEVCTSSNRCQLEPYVTPCVPTNAIENTCTASNRTQGICGGEVKYCEVDCSAGAYQCPTLVKGSMSCQYFCIMTCSSVEDCPSGMRCNSGQCAW